MRHLIADVSDVDAELRIGKAIRKQIETLENGEASADQRHELLVEDQELLKVDLLLAAPAHRDRQSSNLPPRLHQIHEKTLLLVMVHNLPLDISLTPYFWSA